MATKTNSKTEDKARVLNLCFLFVYMPNNYAMNDRFPDFSILVSRRGGKLYGKQILEISSVLVLVRFVLLGGFFPMDQSDMVGHRKPPHILSCIACDLC